MVTYAACAQRARLGRVRRRLRARQTPRCPVRVGTIKAFTYDELLARDKVNLDITWLRDDSLEDLDNLPGPEVIAREIVDDLAAVLAEFEAVATAPEGRMQANR